MISDWETYTLGELGQIKTGKTPPSSLGEGFGGTVPFITPGDMNGQKWIFETDRHLNERGLSAVGTSLMPARSVAVSCIGSDMGKAALLSEPSVTNQQINTIAVDESRFNAEFVYYDLSVRQQELKAAASGSATPILNKGHFSAVEISVPPRATQDKIAGILGRLDDKININRRINQTLEAMAQAIFKSWFVDFDPVKAKIAAKAEGRDPLRAAMSAISGKAEDELDALPPEQYEQLAATAALFPDEMVESELGEIPEGWSIGTLDDLLVLQRGFDLPSQHRVPGNYNIIAASGFSGTHNEAAVKGPGVVTGRSGVLGKVFFAHDDYWPLNTTLWIKEFRIATPCFAFELLKRLDLGVFNSGSAVPTLNRNHISITPSIIPLRETIECFERFSIDLRKLIHQNEKETVKLTNLRDTLLPKLLSGELSVAELD